MKSRSRKHPRFNTYDREFKQKVILYAEQQSTREAQRKYGIPESNVRRWRRLKERIFGKDSSSVAVPVMKKKDKKKKSSKSIKSEEGYEYEIENVMLQDYDYNDSSSLDSVPLNQRLASNSLHSSSGPTEQLQSQPLSPTKLKVTRQTNKLQKFSPVIAKPEVPDNNQNEEVCLRWNSHHSNMQTSFPNLLKKEQFVDVTLVADGKMLKCHRVILSSCSTYFEDILQSIEHNQHPVIFLKGIPFWILKSLTDFMYVGEVNIDQNKLQELLDVAEILKIKGLAGKSDNSQEPVGSKVEKESKKFEPSRLSQPPVLEPQVKPPLRSSQKRNERIEEERRGSATTHVKPAVLPPEQMPITDPLELLEPTYQEETRAEEEPSSSKQRELKPPSRKAISKKIRKRKVPETEDSQIPFRLRRGTRSRPNVKVPRYYHNDFDTQVQTEQGTENDTDPLSHVDSIKTEPVDIVSIDYNEDENSDHRLIHIESEGESEDVLITGLEVDRVLVPNMIQEAKEKAQPYVASVPRYSGDNSSPHEGPETRISIRLSTANKSWTENENTASTTSKQENATRSKRHSVKNQREKQQTALDGSNEINVEASKLKEGAVELSEHNSGDSLDDEPREIGLDISDTIVQRMDSDSGVLHNDSQEEESREVALDISDTVVQTMDSDSDLVHSNLQDIHSPKDATSESMEDKIENVQDISAADVEKNGLLEEPFTENISQDSISQDTSSPKSILNLDENPTASLENSSASEPFKSQVDNIQITQIMSLNTGETDDSLMDIEENRLLDCNYGENEEKMDEQETSIQTSEYDERLLESNVEKV